ncbi:hypothetical protein L484_007256 [Morus notabilis]|uniref:Uncharacterized protein n=1 Tax=Morus notabilis TaxID=981085 RepID=W9RCE2_9ROSA|nr:hypothetical protein L484_007256 [Morus notabilis]
MLGFSGDDDAWRVSRWCLAAMGLGMSSSAISIQLPAVKISFNFFAARNLRRRITIPPFLFSSRASIPAKTSEGERRFAIV